MNTAISAAKQWLQFSFSLGLELWTSGFACVPFGLVPYRYQNPYPFYKRLRERSPIHRSLISGGVILSRAEHIRWAFEESELTADLHQSKVWQGGRRDPHSAHDGSSGAVALAFNDSPDHPHLRNAVFDAIGAMLSNAHVAQWAKWVDDFMQRMPASGKVDLISELATPVARGLCAELLGIAPAQRDTLNELLHEGLIFAFHDGDRLTRFPIVFKSYRGQSQCRRESVRRVFQPLFTSCNDQRPGLITCLQKASAEGKISVEQAVALAEEIMVAAFEAVSFQLGNTLLGLASHPAIYDQLRRQPNLVDAAVKEFERYDSAVQAAVRFAPHDLTLEGNRIYAGEQVTLLLGSANRDPRAFERPDAVELDRPHLRHFTYGTGRHMCAGKRVSRLFQKLVLERFVNRYRSQKAAGSPTWTDVLPMRGLKSLPVVLG